MTRTVTSAARRSVAPKRGKLPKLDPKVIPNVEDLVTEDGAPVDNVFVEKQYRLLTEPLYSSWPGPGIGREFLVMANVGLFFSPTEPPLAPDVMLSVDVKQGADLSFKENRSYFIWLIQKAPDVTIEIVSDRRGGEEGHKFETYARWGVPYYVIFDPRNILKHGKLRQYEKRGRVYVPIDRPVWAELGLGLTFWTGTFERSQQTWLRWCDLDGRLIPTGAEHAREEKQLASDAKRRADDEKRRADDEKRRADDEKRRADAAVAELERLKARQRGKHQ